MNQGSNESEKGKRGGWVFIEDDCGGEKEEKQGRMIRWMKVQG